MEDEREKLHRRSRPGASNAVDAAPAPVAGRRTLTEDLPDAQPLPYLTEIQRSFGRHSLAGLRAHIGALATSRARGLGARAFTSNARAVFAETPTLFLAAHEAAHYVQQRAGVAVAADHPGDEHEVHADAVASQVVAGESAEALLDLGVARGGGSAAPRDSVQRKAIDASASAPAPEHKPKRTLAEGQHYKAVPGQFAVVVDVAWYREGGVEDGGRVLSLAKELEILMYLRATGTLGWATPDALAAAAKTFRGIASDLTTGELTVRLGANVLAVVGLPPASSAMVSREGADALRVAVRMDTTGLAMESSTQVGGITAAAIYRALESFVGMPIPQDARVDEFTMHVGNGAVYRSVANRDLEQMFGHREWERWKTDHRGASTQSGPGEAVGAQSVAHELTDAEKARLSGWLAENVGSSGSGGGTHLTRELLAMVDDIETGPSKRYRGAIISYLRAHARGDGAVNPLSFQRAIDAAIKTDFGADKSSPLEQPPASGSLEPLLQQPLPAHMTYTRGLVLDGDSVAFAVDFDWAALTLLPKAHEAFIKRKWHADVAWVFERTDKATKPLVRHTSHDDNTINISQALSLAPGESEGTWTVHAWVRTSHFPETRITAQIQVKSETARMADLRAEALGDLASPAALELDGSRYSGPLAFKPRTPSERADGRSNEIARLEQVRDYLAKTDNARHTDAIAAVDQQIDRRREQDKAIKNDVTEGWRTFDVRATYLSKVPEVASGPLDIYGAVKRTTLSSFGGELVEVKLRDLSRRFEQEVYEFDGYGRSFEEALEAATVKLCKDYPKGRLALFAEEQDARGEQATGKTVGFERETYSTWHAIKDKVFHPLAQVAVAAASAAIMIFAPEAVAAIPLMVNAVYGTVQTVDDLVHRLDNHTLTWKQATIGMGTIGLNVLPFAWSAKSIKTSANAMFVLEAAELGGQAILLAAQVKEQLVTMQAVDVAAIGEMYSEMIDLEKTLPASDPRLGAMRAQIEDRATAVRGRLADAFSQAAGQQLLFMVPGHVFKAIKVGRTFQEPSLRAEYQRTRQVIEEVLSGARPVRVREADAKVESTGGHRGQEVAGHPELRELSINDLTATERARFLNGYEKIFADAERYYMRRPKPHGTGANATSGASPFGGAHHVRVASEHGLISTRSTAMYEGERSNVHAAAGSYRAAGYFVTESVTTSGFVLVEVRSADGDFATTLRSWHGDAPAYVPINDPRAGATRSNGEVRAWYKEQISRVAALDDGWLADGVSLAERARRAFEVRRHARRAAREQMQVSGEVQSLSVRDLAEYGDPDGPDFEQLVAEHTGKGMTPDQAYQAIIDSSRRSNARHDQRHGMGEKRR